MSDEVTDQQFGLAILGFLIQFIALLSTGIWKLTRVEQSLREAVVAQRMLIDEELEKLRREVGETILAIRHKITEIELFNRDTFVRRDSFQEVAHRISAELSNSSEKNERRLERIETKIEAIQLQGRTLPTNVAG